MDKQKKMLQNGLMLIFQYARKTPTGKHGMDKMANRHGREHINVKPELYTFWRDSVLRAIEEHDPEFNDELAAQWRDLLQLGADVFVSHY